MSHYLNCDVLSSGRLSHSILLTRLSICLNQSMHNPHKVQFFIKSYQLFESRTVWKVSKYGVISGPHFPTFRLNTEIYFVNLYIQSDYKKIRTRNNSVFGHISRSVKFIKFILFLKRAATFSKHYITKSSLFFSLKVNMFPP